MIPHQLQIKNFLSYGPETQTIDFTNHHLICLSGKNGHGKSALLDAITWAIWGQARKPSGTSKPDASLLHLGQKHMMVILEFEVNGQRYRVRREYLNTATKPFATLDFGVQQPDGKQIALTDKTIKDTQEKIERTIGITYESFTNSTFLRQGQSNEFSKKSPKERKEVLAQILQLQRFEHQKKIALMHARKLQQDYASQCSIQERIGQELTTLAHVTELYAIVQEKLQGLDLTKQTLTTQKNSIIKKQQELQQQLSQCDFIQQQLSEITQIHTTTQQDIVKLEQAMVQQPEHIDPAELKSKEETLFKQVQQQQEAQLKKSELKETYLLTKETLTQKITVAQQQHTTQTQLLQMQAMQQQEALRHLNKQLQTEQIAHQKTINDVQLLEKNIVLLQKQTEKAQLIQQQCEETELNFEKNKAEYQSLCMQGTYLKQELATLTGQINHQVKEQHKSCTLCLQPLNKEQQEIIQNKLLLQQQETQKKFTEIKEQATQLKQQLTADAAMLQQLKQQREDSIHQVIYEQEQRKLLEQLTSTLCQQKQNIQDLQQEEITNSKLMQQVEQKMRDLQISFNQLMMSNEYKDLEDMLKVTEQEARNLGYQPTHHHALEAELAIIRQKLAAYSSSTDENALQQNKTLLDQLKQKIVQLTEQKNQLTQKLVILPKLEQSKKELETQELSYQKQEFDMETEYRQWLVEKGSLEQKQKKQIDLDTELRVLNKNIQSIHQEMTDYQEIAKALGKDGIQALLIEQAIPEIEHETNQILARLTNNQTQIFIESLRDLKKGGSRETLDIKIADSFGLRDYEMFSGGEAFRIDFALRIGISKLLARRAGTTLQTIFIDEGFGSQDEEGLQLIMDNIYKIQDDFAKIVIVSHLPEMKEQFPVQFIIEKKRLGSTVTVVLQG